jgi:hypothetical protein
LVNDEAEIDGTDPLEPVLVPVLAAPDEPLDLLELLDELPHAATAKLAVTAKAATIALLFSKCIGSPLLELRRNAAARGERSGPARTA